MFELLSLEDIAHSMKWGFLSDNIVHIIDKIRSGSYKLNKNEKEIVKGAIDFFEMVKSGIDNIGKYSFAGGIEKIVECLTVYNYTSEIFMSEENKYENFSTEVVKKKVEDLLKICWELYDGSNYDKKEMETLRKFFLSLGKFTLQESTNLLENQPKVEITSWRSRKTLENVL